MRVIGEEPKFKVTVELSGPELQLIVAAMQDVPSPTDAVERADEIELLSALEKIIIESSDLDYPSIGRE